MENDSTVVTSPISNGDARIHDEPSHDSFSSNSTITDLGSKLARLSNDDTELEQAEINSFDLREVVHLKADLICAKSAADQAAHESQQFQIENQALDRKVKELEENVAANEKKVAELEAAVAGLEKEMVESGETKRKQVRYLEEKLERATKELEEKDGELSLAKRNAAVTVSEVEALQRSMVEMKEIEVVNGGGGVVEERVGSKCLPYAVTAVSAGTVAAAITILCLRVSCFSEESQPQQACYKFKEWDPRR